MIPNFAEHRDSWRPIIELARSADQAGVDRVAVSDHIAFGERLEAYGDPQTGGVTGGRQPTTPDGHWLEPLTLLSVLAGTTQSVRLSTGILLAALRPAAVLAKQTATLDVLSNGRLDLGVGIGWQREEYDVCGLDFGRRGDLLDRTLEICTMLWTQQVSSYDDGDIAFDRIHTMPKPVQPGGVPLWISGRVQARMTQRLVRFGVGWIPWGDDAADPTLGIPALRHAFEAAGRDPDELQVQGGLTLISKPNGSIDLPATLESVVAQADAGITDFRVRHRWSFDNDRDAELLTDLVAEFRSAVGRPPVAEVRVA